MHAPRAAVSHCESEIQRIVNSELLSHSPSLVRLFRYLAERALGGDAETLKEYTIGVEALDKPSGYDTQADPSVRSQVRRLRAKLAQYYEDEGRNNPLRITVPKGSFQLHFEEAPVLRADPPRESGYAVRRWRRIAAALALALGVLATWHVYASTHGASNSSLASEATVITGDIREIWAPYLNRSRPGIISLGIPVFFQLHRDRTEPGGPGNVVIRDTRLNSHDAPETADRIEGWRELVSAHAVEPWHNYMAVGEALGAYRLGKTLLGAGVDLPIVRSNALSWDEIRANDVIFLGAPKLHPHLQIDDLTTHFRITNWGVENLSPSDGEAESYRNTDNGRERAGFAVVGRYPAPVGRGYATVVGSNMNLATWAAVEYLTRPHHARAFVEGMNARFGEFPPYFEALIHAQFHDETPIKIEWIALRRVETSPSQTTD